jgi:hypothetical protein
VVLGRLEEHPVASPDHLDLPALALAETNALGDPDRLTMRMRVPGGSGAGREVDARGADLGASDGAATVSTNTEPVNQSPGPGLCPGCSL